MNQEPSQGGKNEKTMFAVKVVLGWWAGHIRPKKHLIGRKQD